MIDKITILEVHNNFVKMTFRLLKTVFKAWTALVFLFVFIAPCSPETCKVEVVDSVLLAGNYILYMASCGRR